MKISGCGLVFCIKEVVVMNSKTYKMLWNIGYVLIILFGWLAFSGRLF